MLKKLHLGKAFIFFCYFFYQTVNAASPDNWQLNMFKGVTPMSHEIYKLHTIAMLICLIIGLIVFGVMIFSLIYHRKSKSYPAATFHDNSRLEIFWTIIPFLILVGLAFPATKTLIRLGDTERPELTIKIVGSQWKWEYDYLDEGLHFYSNLSTPFAEIENKKDKNPYYLLQVDKPVVVPVGKKIRFLVTSTDVVHSWWVPQLGIKRDAIPGFMYESWAKIKRPGVYRGQCTELCGVGHGYMPIVVEAVDPKVYQVWLNDQLQKQKIWLQAQQDLSMQKTMTRQELMRLGKAKYNQVCAQCHQVNGLGIPPLYPALKGSSIAVGYPIARHINMILNGSPGSAMQAYGQMLSNEDIAAIVTYERNAWENNTNDLIQAIDVAQARIQKNIAPKIIVQKFNPGGLK